MTRRVRWPVLALALLGGLLLCAGLRLALVVASLNPAALEGRLRQSARERTGHDLTLEGARIDLFPRPALELSAVRLGPAPGFGPQPLAEAARVRAAIRVLPLFSRRVQVGAVTVEDLRVDLTRGPTGRGSWETLAERFGAGAGKEGSIPSLRLVRASVHLRDLKRGWNATVRDLNLGLGPGRGARELSFQGEFSVDDPAARGRVRGDARIGPLHDPILAILDLALEVTAETEERQLGLRIEGRGAWDGEELDLPDLAARFSFRGAVPDAATTEVDLRGALRAGAEGLRLEGASIEAAGARLGLDLAAAGLPEDPVVTGTLAIPRQDLGPALARLGTLSAPGPALGEVSGTLPFRWQGGVLTCAGVVLEVAGGRIGGALTVLAFHPPQVEVDLLAEGLDLDRVRLTGDGATRPPHALSALRLDGRVRARGLRMAGVVIDEADLPVRLWGGTLRLQGARLAALGGTLDLALEVPLVAGGWHEITVALVDLDLGRALAAVGDERGLTGTLGASGALGASSAAEGISRRTAEGRLCFALRDGVLPTRGGDRERPAGARGARTRRATERVSGIAEQLVARVRKRGGRKFPEKIAFERLDACFDVEGGVATTTDLVLDGDGLDLAGVGTIDLGAGTLDLSCRVVVEDLAPLGLRIHGSLDDPAVDREPLDRLDLVRDLVDARRTDHRERMETKLGNLTAMLAEAAGPAVRRRLDAREEDAGRLDEARARAEERRETRRERRRRTLDKLRGGREAADTGGEAQEGVEVPAGR